MLLGTFVTSGKKIESLKEGPSTLLKEGLMPGFGSFLVSWIFVYNYLLESGGGFLMVCVGREGWGLGIGFNSFPFFFFFFFCRGKKTRKKENKKNYITQSES